MAYNWTISEVAKELHGTNTGNKMDIGKRFPLTAMLVAAMNEAGLELLKNGMAATVSARKVEMQLKGDASHEVEVDGEEVEADEAGEKVVPLKGAAKAAAAKKAKVAEPEPEEEEADEEAEGGKYEGMRAKDAYDACVKRGLKVTVKKPADYYIAALEKDDAVKEAAKAKVKPAPKAKAKVEEPEDDWGDDEEEAPAPKAKAGKPATKAKAKAEADEDDDWDL